MKRNLILHVNDYVNGLTASGHCNFISHKAQETIGALVDATMLTLNRLARQKLVACYSYKFIVIVPLEAVIVSVINCKDRIGGFQHAAAVFHELVNRTDSGKLHIHRKYRACAGYKSTGIEMMTVYLPNTILNAVQD